MEKLRRWLSKTGFKLEVGKNLPDEVCFTMKCVTINGSSTKRTRLYSLLHECGHVAIWKCRVKNPQRDVCGCTLKRADHIMTVSPSRLTNKDKLDVISEEVEAWERGRRLAKRLKIRVNKEKFTADKTRALMTYHRWCVS